MSDMAPAEAAPHERMSKRARFTVVTVVARFLHVAELAQLAKGSFTEKRFPMGPEKDQYTQSPITSAVEYFTDPENHELLACLNLPPKPSVAATKVAVKNACDYWFWQFAMSKRSSFADKPRRTKGDWNLDAEDFTSLGNLLTTAHWQDEYGNARLFASLEEMLRDSVVMEQNGDRPCEERREACNRVAELRRIKQKASGRAHEDLDTLLRRVQEKCRFVCMHVVAGTFCGACSHPLNA